MSAVCLTQTATQIPGTPSLKEQATNLRTAVTKAAISWATLDIKRIPSANTLG